MKCEGLRDASFKSDNSRRWDVDPTGIPDLEACCTMKPSWRSEVAPAVNLAQPAHLAFCLDEVARATGQYRKLIAFGHGQNPVEIVGSEATQVRSSLSQPALGRMQGGVADHGRGLASIMPGHCQWSVWQASLTGCRRKWEASWAEVVEAGFSYLPHNKETQCTATQKTGTRFALLSGTRQPQHWPG